MPSKKKSLTSIGARSYSPPRAAKAPGFAGRVIKLHDVAKHGLTHKVETPSDMSRVRLMATNPTGTPFGIDSTGSFLSPTNNGFQRLLIAGAEGATEGLVIVSPGATVAMDLLTACMDQHKRPPDGEVEYELSTKPAPERFQPVARAFADLASQGKSRLPESDARVTAQSRAIRKLVGAPSCGNFQSATWDAAGN